MEARRVNQSKKKRIPLPISNFYDCDWIQMFFEDGCLISICEGCGQESNVQYSGAKLSQIVGPVEKKYKEHRKCKSLVKDKVTNA